MNSSVSAEEVKLEKLRSNAMRGKWPKVFEMYVQERALRTAKITGTGDTVLHMAVSNGQEKVVANMVNLLVLEENKLGQNNVVVIVDEDDEESWKANNVLGSKNDRKNTPLHLAATMGNVEMCRKIGGTDPSLITRRNIAGETPLFLAALNGRKEAFLWLHYLYVASHRISSTDVAHCIRDNDDTILHCAIEEGHFDVAVEIVHLYKDLVRRMRRNKEGLSPLHLLAAKRSAFKSVGLLELSILGHPIYWFSKVEGKNQATTLEELQQCHKAPWSKGQAYSKMDMVPSDTKNEGEAQMGASNNEQTSSACF
ncbi:ankyrin repeat domain-containing protein 27-like isoform X2 [Neltuma alba]|nr:ankyrin repeat domain-containing protein 27-like isoform X2 [Prosopis alba]